MEYLHEIDGQVPPEVFTVSDKYFLYPKDYIKFATAWLSNPTIPSMYMDLLSLAKHTLIFHLQCVSPICRDQISQITIQVIESTLKSSLAKFPNFIYILCCKPGSADVKIFLPEFIIGYDDYLFLCDTLQDKFNHTLSDGTQYHLKALTKAVLSEEPGKPGFIPMQVVYTDARDTLYVSVSEWTSVKKNFRCRRDNVHSLFKELIPCTGPMVLTKLREYMMPLPLSSTHYTLAFRTVITAVPSGSCQFVDVGTLTLQDQRCVTISKGREILNQDRYLLKAY